MCYSLDFRQKVLSVRAKDNLTLATTAKRFDVGIASISRWLKRIEVKPTRNKPAVKINMQHLQEDIDKYTDAYYNRARAYEKLKQYDKAEADYNKTIELDVEYKTNAFSNRANLYIILNQYDKAEADYTKAIELDSKNPEPYNNRADFYKDIEQYDKAKSDYTKAINLEDALFSPE